MFESSRLIVKTILVAFLLRISIAWAQRPDDVISIPKYVCLLTISIVSFAYLKFVLFLFCPLPLNMMILVLLLDDNDNDNDNDNHNHNHNVNDNDNDDNRFPKIHFPFLKS